MWEFVELFDAVGKSDGEFFSKKAAGLKNGARVWIATELHHLTQRDAGLWETGEVVQLRP